jgi:hypothetical protein
MASVASPWELVPVVLGSVLHACFAMVCSREPVPFDYLGSSICTAGFQLVSQACLALFDLYTSYI